MAQEQKRKRQGRFLYNGFGFPVLLLDVPMVQVRGDWTPDVDYNQLARRLLLALAGSPVRLIGNEIRFIRHSLSMTLEQFAQRFGVTHPAVIKWEQTGNRSTSMTWAVEKDIRLEILRSKSEGKPLSFVKAYAALREKMSARSVQVRLQVGKSA